MSRLQPMSLFSDVFPDRKDVNNLGNYLCRFCGKPTINSRRKYYCSDECYWNCQKSISWWFARQGTFKRDEEKCVKCGKKLDYNDAWDCHHIIPVEKLNPLAVATVYNNPEWKHCSERDKDHGFAIIYTLLIHDINNLITLCSGCHKREHAATPESINYEAEILTLEHFFNHTKTIICAEGKENEEP